MQTILPPNHWYHLYIFNSVQMFLQYKGSFHRNIKYPFHFPSADFLPTFSHKMEYKKFIWGKPFQAWKSRIYPNQPAVTKHGIFSGNNLLWSSKTSYIHFLTGILFLHLPFDFFQHTIWQNMFSFLKRIKIRFGYYSLSLPSEYIVIYFLWNIFPVEKIC